jgi:hypothetical protein
MGKSQKSGNMETPPSGNQNSKKNQSFHPPVHAGGFLCSKLSILARRLPTILIQSDNSCRILGVGGIEAIKSLNVNILLDLHIS